MTPSPRDNFQGVYIESEEVRGAGGFKDNLITYFTYKRSDLEFSYIYYRLWNSNKNSEKRRRCERVCYVLYEECTAITLEYTLFNFSPEG